MGKIHAFILAAGLGERVRPLSDHIPKPLLPILGKPALERILDRISTLPVQHIGINLHHNSSVVQAWINGSRYAEKIHCFPEKTLLGTGGALKNAASLLGQSVFLAHNSDIITDIPLNLLVEKHLSEGNVVTLAIHEYPKYKSVWIHKDGSVNSIGKRSSESVRTLRHVSFTGIAVYSPLFLELLPVGTYSIIEYWNKAIELHQKVGTVDCTGCEWSDIGTPQSYAATVFQYLQKRGSALYVHPSAECSTVTYEGYAAIEEGVHLAGRTMIKDSILLPGFTTKTDALLENIIAGPTFRVDIKMPYIMLNNEDDILSLPMVRDFIKTRPHETVVRLIGSGGSDRIYYRIRADNRSAILMKCTDADPDYQRHLLFTSFFRKYAVPVPALIASDPGNQLALFEDVGDTTLCAWLQCTKHPDIVEQIYKTILDVLVVMHTRVTERSGECPGLHTRLFDHEHCRWETAYFIEQFVKGVKGLTPKNESRLDGECTHLAQTVDAFAKSVLHRDFQSQNIMITRKDDIRILDYQGARMGPPAYDIVSLLWDPYYCLKDDMRMRLIDYYLKEMKNALDDRFDQYTFTQSLLPCRLQRHMQALGAYGFLSRIKGKNYFMNYVPRALVYLLDEITSVKKIYPELYELVTNCNEETHH